MDRSHSLGDILREAIERRKSSPQQNSDEKGTTMDQYLTLEQIFNMTTDGSFAAFKVHFGANCDRPIRLTKEIRALTNCGLVDAKQIVTGDRDLVVTGTSGVLRVLDMVNRMNIDNPCMHGVLTVRFTLYEQNRPVVI